MSRKFSVVQFFTIAWLRPTTTGAKKKSTFHSAAWIVCKSFSGQASETEIYIVCASSLAYRDIWSKAFDIFEKFNRKNFNKAKMKTAFFLIEKAPRRSSKMLIYAGGVSLRSYAHAIPIISRRIESELRATTLCLCRLAKMLRNKTAEEGKNVINVRPILSISHSSLTYIITFDMEISLARAWIEKSELTSSWLMFLFRRVSLVIALLTRFCC